MSIDAEADSVASPQRVIPVPELRFVVCRSGNTTRASEVLFPNGFSVSDDDLDCVVTPDPPDLVDADAAGLHRFDSAALLSRLQSSRLDGLQLTSNNNPDRRIKTVRRRKRDTDFTTEDLKKDLPNVSKFN